MCNGSCRDVEVEQWLLFSLHFGTVVEKCTAVAKVELMFKPKYGCKLADGTANSLQMIRDMYMYATSEHKRIPKYCVQSL